MSVSVVGLCPLIERGQDSPALRSFAWPSRVDSVRRTLEVMRVCAVLPFRRWTGLPLTAVVELTRGDGFAFAGHRTFQAETFPSCM